QEVTAMHGLDAIHWTKAAQPPALTNTVPNYGTIVDRREAAVLDLTEVLYFVQADERKGMSAAARALDAPKSTVSRRIQALESALGARLIQRTTRSFALTEMGRECYALSVATLVEAETAENAVRERLAEPSGTIRFSCPVPLAHLC